MAAVVARPDVQHPQRVPHGGLPAVWCSGARSRSLSTNTQGSWKMCSFGWPPGTVGLKGALAIARALSQIHSYRNPSGIRRTTDSLDQWYEHGQSLTRRLERGRRQSQRDNAEGF